MPYGTANVDTIQSSTAGTPVQFNDGNGTQVGTLARAWCNFTVSGTTVTVQSSFNVSSIVRNSTGSYNCNFTNALSDAKYSATGSTSINTAGTYSCVFILNTSGGPTTTAFNFWTIGINNTLYDPSYVSLAVFR